MPSPRAEDSDAASLLRRYCTGRDQQAFRRFYSQEAPRLWRFLVARGCPREDAYDLVAEAFTRFIAVVCRDPAHPRALLYRIALNARIDLHRRRETAGEAVEVEAVADALPAAGPDLTDSLAVRRAIGQLYPEEQNLLLMRYWIGLTHAEIAQVLELPEGTVRRQGAAALHRLRDLFGGGA